MNDRTASPNGTSSRRSVSDISKQSANPDVTHARDCLYAALDQLGVAPGTNDRMGPSDHIIESGEPDLPVDPAVASQDEHRPPGYPYLHVITDDGAKGRLSTFSISHDEVPTPPFAGSDLPARPQPGAAEITCDGKVILGCAE